MTNTKNATAAIKTPEKANATTAQKPHSMPFHISAELFHNKRLRHKRSKWAAAVRKAVANRERKKTEVVRRAGLADVTIDLLSDDDDEAVGSNMQQQVRPHEGITPNYQQHYIVYPDHLQLSQVPNITLIPVQPYHALQSAASAPPPQKRLKRKRKSRLPKRHAQPTIVNNESIVLTDDSDIEEAPQAAVDPPKLTSPTIAPPVTFAQVDEEVTVSIVPRSSAAGSCSKPPNTELFPMLPDETTVHTVISNRIYELSLTKLREGLASCGIPEYASEGQPKVSPPARRSKYGKANAAPATAMPKPAPISLKLSSDLSISLISDDDDEEDAESQHMNAEKLLQRQPQLSVQQLQVPMNYCMIRAPPRQAPRRRKLG